MYDNPTLKPKYSSNIIEIPPPYLPRGDIRARAEGGWEDLHADSVRRPKELERSRGRPGTVTFRNGCPASMLGTIAVIPLLLILGRKHEAMLKCVAHNIRN